MYVCSILEAEKAGEAHGESIYSRKGESMDENFSQGRSDAIANSGSVVLVMGMYTDTE